jgi:DMSO/TMAO reductase YedYZ molybdopterin-dependent catalytic subunit
MLSRRHLLGAGLLLCRELTRPAAALAARLADTCLEPIPGGQLVGLRPLTADRPRATEFGLPLGGPGLDTRQFTDLSKVQLDRMLTPTPEVFVRTAAPPGLEQRQREWSVTIHGRFNSTGVTAEELRRMSRPMGAHVIECAGNNDPNNFGLLSLAEWEGVALADLMPSLRPDYDDYGILVTGLDDETQVARSSVPGASWILPLDGLAELGPFLATRMNGAPLTPDHGAPVRLVVPGWYGCAWIKWVQSLELVKRDALVTYQMAEFASRTHQTGRPIEVTDYAAPVIDVAATPIRVEHWRVGRRTEYRVVGLTWGGPAARPSLEIRSHSRDTWHPVHLCGHAPPPRGWDVWSYRWRPEWPGPYSLSLRAPAANQRQRRLEMFFYTRRVQIDET